MAVTQDNLHSRGGGVGVEAAIAVEAADQAATRLDDLAQVIAAYNQVTENLARSHESLRAEVVRLQQQLASTDAQLQRSKRLAALGEMAAGIAHEIRNPLGAIQLYAGMLVQDLESLAGRHGSSSRGTSDEPRVFTPTLAGATQTARKIASAVHGLNAIVGDVLSFAREITPRCTLVSAVGLFERAVDALRPQITIAGIQVRVQDQTEPITLEVDIDLVHQALLNLIRNAIEAMAEGTPATLTLSARCANDGSDHVLLSVRDTGPGIAEAAIDRIFNPFFTTRDTGTGLGLAIVHRIIDAHAGAIAVHNDGGAVFKISLPRKRLVSEAVRSPA